MPRGTQIPGPPRMPSTVGQQARPSSQGDNVPVMQRQPATRQGPPPQSPSLPQKPEQQSTQFLPQEHVAGQATPSPLQVPAKQRLGGTHVPLPPGRSGLSAQQTRPGTQEPRSPVWQRQPSRAHGRICASARPLPSPMPAMAAAAAACARRARAPRRDLRVASRFTIASNRSCSIRSSPLPRRHGHLSTPRAITRQANASRSRPARRHLARPAAPVAAGSR